MPKYLIHTELMASWDDSSPFDADDDDDALQRAAAIVRPSIRYQLYRIEGSQVVDGLPTVKRIPIYPTQLGEPVYHENGLVKLTPFVRGPIAGVKAEHDDGATEYVVLNPSGGSDDGSVSVFVYHGVTGDPAADAAYVHFDLFDTDDLSQDVCQPCPDPHPEA